MLAVAAILIGVSLSGPRENNNEDVSEQAVQEFSERTQGEIVEQLGQPIEGFLPSMYMQVYEGISEEDFDGVETLIGGYTYSESEGLVYSPGNQRETHSAARAISEEGERKLLVNLMERHNINLNDGDTIDDVIEAIGPVNEQSTGEEITVSGEVVCLPHKDTSGPQTEECAFGVLTEGGDHYGFRNLGRIVSDIDLQTGMQVEVSGNLNEPDDSNIYNIVGEIDVQSISEQ